MAKATTLTYYFKNDFHNDEELAITFPGVIKVEKRLDRSHRLYTLDGRVHFVRGNYVDIEEE